MQFSEIKIKLNELVDTVHGLNKRLDDLGTVASAIGGELDSLPIANQELVVAVNGLADKSSDPAVLTAKAEVDLLKTEYAALKGKVSKILAAME